MTRTIAMLARHGFAFLAIVMVTGARQAPAADWPMWRCDAARSGATRQQLASELHLQWVRHLPTLEVAWPDQEKMWFDRQYEPIVVGQTMFIGSSRTDDVTAYDTRTGDVRWVFPAQGAVRFAPAAADGRVYVASDDGYLYCLAVDDGRLLWKFRGGPSDRRLLGNERLISTWPARGAPVVSDGVVYFAASIWPFMGVFIHALDARTGDVIWTNDGGGSMFMLQPHNSNSFAGVAPQGPLAVAGDMLLIPGGRSVPACYDRHTGKFQYYNLAENGKRGGGSEVVVAGDFFFNGGQVYGVDTGEALGSVRGSPVLTDETVYYFDAFKEDYIALDRSSMRIVEQVTKDRRGKETRFNRLESVERWGAEGRGGEVLLAAGSRLYAAVENELLAFDLPATGEKLEPAWRTRVDGTVARLVAADERLFAVTLSGDVYCFGAEPVSQPTEFPLPGARNRLPRDERLAAEAEHILQTAGAGDGYCLAWGAGSGGLVTELLLRSSLRIVVIEPDAAAALDFRRRLIDAGVYGDRIWVHAVDPTEIELPPYFARLMVAESPSVLRGALSALGAAKVFDSLRPYGGAACIRTGDAQLESTCAAEVTDGVRVAREGEYLLVRRDGPLPGSADWTHEHADAANTRVSRDARVKAPLGMLWFGGPSHEDVLPRHGHGPQPQVIDGRLIIEGVDVIRATDIYTGRLLWRRELPGVGYFFSNTGHQPGANGTGSNFVSTSDGIYVVYENRCLLLDLTSGETVREFTLSTDESSDDAPKWGYINVAGDYLIGGADPLVDERDDELRPKFGGNDNLTSSKRLVVINRQTGDLLWSVEATNRFRHNAVCVGGGRLYAVDLLSQGDIDRLKRRGEKPTTDSALRVFDLHTGAPIWESVDDVFGTWLSYSEEYDVLVEAGRPGRDNQKDEAVGMRVFRAATGEFLWHQPKYLGPAMILGDVIHVPSAAYRLLTGVPVVRDDPITGQSVPWTWKRNYGCNTPMASQNLLTFRSGAAGYYDLANDGGTGNFGGFRSGCTNNLIVAGGVLSAPDYTRTCVCNYQNQASVALVHMPEVEMWTEFTMAGGDNVQSLAVNLGAPGHRRADDGQLWLNEHDDVQVEHDGEFFTGHSSRIAGEGLKWVAASGCRGVTRVVIDPRLNPAPDEPVRYTMRLHFADPDNDQPGRRVFDVAIQGDRVLEGFDVAARAGGRNQIVVEEFAGVEVRDKIVVEFSPVDAAATAPDQVPLLCGIEVHREP